MSNAPASISADDADLAAYSGAQEAARHLDSLLWQVTSIVWGINAVMLSIVVDGNNSTRGSIGLAGLAFLGILLTWFTQLIAWNFRQVRNHAYDLCRGIEKYHDFRHPIHAQIEKFYQTKRMHGHQTILYGFVTGAFTVLWVYVLYVACKA